MAANALVAIGPELLLYELRAQRDATWTAKKTQGLVTQIDSLGPIDWASFLFCFKAIMAFFHCLTIAVQHSLLATMMSNALVAVGSAPLCAAVQAVIVPVAAIQVPVITGCDLVVTGPPLLVR